MIPLEMFTHIFINIQLESCRNLWNDICNVVHSATTTHILLWPAQHSIKYTTNEDDIQPSISIKSFDSSLYLSTECCQQRIQDIWWYWWPQFIGKLESGKTSQQLYLTLLQRQSRQQHLIIMLYQLLKNDTMFPGGSPSHNIDMMMQNAEIRVMRAASEVRLHVIRDIDDMTMDNLFNSIYKNKDILFFNAIVLSFLNNFDTNSRANSIVYSD